MRIIYLGTPEFAVPTLEALLCDPEFEVVAVVCQPDRPKGRGNKMEAPPTKQVAEKHGIKVFQPIALAKAPEVVEAMSELKPDILVMVAFGQILKKAVLTLAPLGVVNVHGSLLPKLRGAAPINWAIINGDTMTGVTTMFTEAGVDTGPMLLKAEIPISEEMTASELSKTMSHVGAALLIDTLKRLKAGTLEPQRQDDSQFTYAPILTKEMGHLDFTRGAKDLHNLVRGLTPWPSTYAKLGGATVKIIKTRPADKGAPANCGTIFNEHGRLFVACGENGEERLEILTLQPESRGQMEAKNWLNGVRLEEGACLA